LKNIIIVGASHAAIEAISCLRKFGWNGNIVLIGDEDAYPYQRPPLSKGYLKGEVGNEKLLLRNPNFYEKHNVRMLLGHKVIKINRKRNFIELNSKETINYHKLILATGTRPRKLEIPGSTMPQIRYLRTIDDVNFLKNKITQNTNLLIIGAGYIGLEVAASAIMRKANVTVIESADRVLSRVTGTAISSFYHKLHATRGVKIHLNSAVAEFGSSQNVNFANFENGDQCVFDWAVVGIGVIPNIEIAEDANLECNNGIMVNEFTQTSDSDIHAIGDCSNHPSFIYQKRIRLESVPNALAQAKTAAKFICGSQQPYDQVPWFWSDQYDIKLQSVGLAIDYDRVILDGDEESHKFTVSYIKNDQIVALDAINSPREFLQAKKEISKLSSSNSNILVPE
jgi:3-phenylpropionate/trans-cinnamate dioxygenase ferredoxin reductase subunit|tara:strand:- start:6842 stop:8029 length:1188 start_codon:yes stop_codon:yes gene_type:complete